MNKLFIDKKSYEMLIEILDKFCPGSEIFAYGSRINGRAHEGSDLDLTIKNFPKDRYIFELKEIFSESNIPFLIDINLFESLPKSFQEEIDRNKVKIYPINS